MNSDSENIISVPFTEENYDYDISDIPKGEDTFILPITTDTLADEDGKIGTLEIPSINLSVGVYQCEDTMEAMNKGVAHFANTSPWNGNIGLSAHNINMNGSDGYFKNLHKLKQGDKIIYGTELGVRTYEVAIIKEIKDTDWSMFDYSKDNKLTLLTCISGKENKRLVVQAKLMDNE